MDTAHPPTLLQLLSSPSLSLTDIARSLNLDTPVLIAQLNDPTRGIPPLLAAERARTQLLASQHLSSTLHTITAATQHVTSLIHSILPSSPSTPCHLDTSTPPPPITHSTTSVSSSSDPSAKCLVPSALPSSPSALSTQHSVLLLHSTDVLRRCAMLFERIANPRALRERAGFSPAASSNSAALSPHHPFSFSATPSPRCSPEYAKPMHPGAHPYRPPHYTRLCDNSSYYWCTDTRDWQLWDTARQGPITASPFSLSFRSETHYHWDSASNRWWIHTPFKCTPVNPPPEFPIPGDSDFDPDAPPTPRPHRIHSLSPQSPKPVSFLTESTTSPRSSPSSPQSGASDETGASAPGNQPHDMASTEGAPLTSSAGPSSIHSATTCDSHPSEVHVNPQFDERHITSIFTNSEDPSALCADELITRDSDPLPHNNDLVGSILNEFYLARREQGTLKLPWLSRPPTTEPARKTSSSPDTAAPPPSSPTSAKCLMPSASSSALSIQHPELPPDRPPPY